MFARIFILRDITLSLNNLKSVRDLKCNLPVFNPSDDYLIPDGAVAIVIKHRVATYGVKRGSNAA